MLVALCGCAVRDGVLRNGPAVQPPLPGGVRVAFETTHDIRAVLDLASPGGALVRSVEDPAPSRRHVFTLTGLDPDKRYGYRIHISGAPGVLAEGSAATPPAGPSRSIRVAVLGDSGPIGLFRTKRQGDVARLAARFEPDIVLHMGDVVYSRGGDPIEEFDDAYFLPFASLVRSTPVYATPGNHDQSLSECIPYLRAFELPLGPEGERYYSFDYGPAHFASVDTSTRKALTGRQLEWLEQDLASSRLPWKVVFTHQPPLGTSELDVRNDPPPLAPLLDLCARAGVRLLLTGHHHAYLRYRPLEICPGGLTLVVSGGGGAALIRRIGVDPRLAYSALVHHHVRLRIELERIELEAVGLDGSVFDRFTIERLPSVSSGREALQVLHDLEDPGPRLLEERAGAGGLVARPRVVEDLGDAE